MAQVIILAKMEKKSIKPKKEKPLPIPINCFNVDTVEDWLTGGASTKKSKEKK